MRDLARRPSNAVIRKRRKHVALPAQAQYDLAGRVYSGVPAPYNLPVPPYHFPTDTTVRIGQNPEGKKFELSSVVQM